MNVGLRLVWTQNYRGTMCVGVILYCFRCAERQRENILRGYFIKNKRGSFRIDLPIPLGSLAVYNTLVPIRLCEYDFDTKALVSAQLALTLSCLLIIIHCLPVVGK
jgi:hypothetical protein